MEYYNGILFLTTNRPGVIDEAVQSRVHMTLRYEALGLDQTTAIFAQNITQLRNIERKRATALKVKEMDIFEEDILSFAKKHWEEHNDGIGRWNGRQIRNAFSTAASLAHFEAREKPGRDVQLRAEHFQKVQTATMVYEKYRASILSGTDGEIAKQHEARNDDFDEHMFNNNRGPQARRGQRAMETASKYGYQAQGPPPSTPVRTQDQYVRELQPQMGSPVGGGYPHQTSGYASAQTGGYYVPHQSAYPPPQPQFHHPQGQERGYSAKQQDEYRHLTQPGSYIHSQEIGHSPAPRGLSPSLNMKYPGPQVSIQTPASYTHKAETRAQGSPYLGRDIRGQTPG